MFFTQPGSSFFVLTCKIHIKFHSHGFFRYSYRLIIMATHPRLVVVEVHAPTPRLKVLHEQHIGLLARKPAL
jgi:hypothetical protein